jgi:hypothetical protein
MTVAKRLLSGEGLLVRVLSRGMTFFHSLSAIIADCTRRRLSMAIDGESSHPARLLQRKRRRLASPDADRVGAERPTPAQSLIDDYNTRRSATDRFPPKITPQDIREAMLRTAPCRFGCKNRRRLEENRIKLRIQIWPKTCTCSFIMVFIVYTFNRCYLPLPIDFLLLCDTPVHLFHVFDTPLVDYFIMLMPRPLSCYTLLQIFFRFLIPL